MTTIQPCASTEPKPVIKTEDLGKMFEMAICLAFNTQFDGKYKYGMDFPTSLAPRLAKLAQLFPACTHTAKKGARYDYTSTDGTHHLSAKTTKKGVGKVAPQVIGQSQPKKFCEIVGVEFSTIPILKEYIRGNVQHILKILLEHTFDCPNVYFNQEKNKILHIVLATPIVWENYQYKWTNDWIATGSSTLKILVDGAEIALVEFQFHTKSRTNMAIRWFYENFLAVFKNNLAITDI